MSIRENVLAGLWLNGLRVRDPAEKVEQALRCRASSVSRRCRRRGLRAEARRVSFLGGMLGSSATRDRRGCVVLVGAVTLLAGAGCGSQQVSVRRELVGRDRVTRREDPRVVVAVDADDRAVAVFTEHTCVERVVERWETVHLVERTPSIGPMAVGAVLMLLGSAVASCGSGGGHGGCSGRTHSGAVAIAVVLPLPLVVVPLIEATDDEVRTAAPGVERGMAAHGCEQRPMPDAWVTAGTEAAITSASGWAVFPRPIDPRTLTVQGRAPSEVRRRE